MKVRWLHIILALIAALLFARSVWFREWWTAGDVSVGPFGSRNCFGGECRSGGLTFLGGSAVWLRVAVATWAAALVAMISLMALAGAIAAGRVPKLVARMTLVSLGTALVAGAYFVLARPDFPTLSVAQGVYTFFAAVVIGAVPAVVVARA